jgi:hypothetical protein
VELAGTTNRASADRAPILDALTVSGLEGYHGGQKISRSLFVSLPRFLQSFTSCLSLAVGMAPKSDGAPGPRQ